LQTLLVGVGECLRRLHGHQQRVPFLEIRYHTVVEKICKVKKSVPFLQVKDAKEPKY
jgi:hypothetical protein